MISDIPIVMSPVMQTLLSELFLTIKGSALLCNEVNEHGDEF